MIKLLRDHFPLYILFFACMFFVGLGQTFFVSQYIPFIRESLELSRSEISFVYSLATFLASFNLPFLGMALDRYPQMIFFVGTSICLCLGLSAMAFSTSILTLFVGFYLLRGFGQMPLSLLAVTNISKYFGENRGKFLTISGIGRPISEGVIPFVAISLITAYGWRDSLHIFMFIFIIVMFPIAFSFIPDLPKAPLYPENKNLERTQEKEEKWSWKLLAKERWPLYIMLNNALIPFILTGLFFQQDIIASFKGWDLKVMAYSFSAYSVVYIFSSFFWGPLIDKVSATRLFPYKLIPLAVGLFILIIVDHVAAVYIYMGLNGLSIALTGLVRNSFWAEIYGIKQLGSLKGFDSNITVMGTALAPALYAWLLALGMTAQSLLIALLILTLLGIMNCYIIYSKFSDKIK